MPKGYVTALVQIAALLMGLTWGNQAQATVLIQEDFEVPDLPSLAARGWQIYDNAPGNLNNGGTCMVSPCSMDVVTMTGHTGASTRVLRMIYGTEASYTEAGDARLIWFLSTPQNEIWERYWYYTTPNPPGAPHGYMPANATKHHYFKAGGTTFDGLPSMITDNFFGDPNMGIQMVEPASKIGGATNLTPNGSVPFYDNHWFCVETHLKYGTPNGNDGVMEIWIDGTTTMTYSGLNILNTAHAGGAINSLTVYRQGAVSMYRYEDDYMMATTRIGCSSSPSDTIAPTPPSGLRVQ